MSTESLYTALVGTPNCGKTALFNLITGARQKVANYAGATVERKEGRFLTASGRSVRLLDLPGTYSLESQSADERIAADVLAGNYPGEAPPNLVICVVDATNLRLHLRFVLEVQRLGRPMVLALNMTDAAQRQGIRIDKQRLAAELGMPVASTVAIRRGGADELIRLLDEQREIAPPVIRPLDDLHQEARRLMACCVSLPQLSESRIDAIDRVVLHPVVGPLLLVAVMFMVFQGVYSLGKPLTDLIGAGFDALNAWAASVLPAGPIQGLLCEGLIGGLGTVLGFLPEILVLFFFILILEESGYLPRAAFLLDRAMLAVGLTGRSFIPLLSSFACAIPGIIGSRSISDSRDRWTTILVAPLMTCSARLPVYALLISAFIPDRTIANTFNLQGLVLFGLYLLGILGAMAVGWVCKKLRGSAQEPPTLILELPAYRLPRPRNVALGLWEKGVTFLRKLTGVILALTIIMWAISSFPGAPVGASGPAIDYSIAGYLGRSLQFFFAPLGFNWQITLALIPAFAARETAVATLATIYSVADAGDVSSLAETMAQHISLASAVSLMVWFAFAPQCMSTLAVIRKETLSWRKTAIAFSYMFVVAYAGAFAAYHLLEVLI
ncbi:ferrous iron transporter B [Pseudomonas oryzihabitans]|uniref:ferrous iron transporter B n=1 Tax=Pseudomonas oryzihabitans TaxID=47885 RepID=UPI00285AFA78|nr:ferrous iron transporter B [Pseudomonas psychrotolerans]MDR6676354.1 ferrous iron transport protein B [Pseudomonas psychrotolerans]